MSTNHSQNIRALGADSPPSLNTAFFPNERNVEPFLERWAEVLPRRKWGDFLTTWFRSLSYIGGDANLIEPNYRVELRKVRGREYPWTLVDVESAHRQKLSGTKSRIPYTPVKALKDYSIRTDLSCLLCSRVLQSLDAQGKNTATGVIKNLGDFLIIPNRYPIHPGVSLLLPKNHDDSAERVTPTRNSKGELEWIPGDRVHTRGRVMQASDLLTLIIACDALNMFGVKNHVLESMSIPMHDHMHLFPEDLPVAQFLKEITQRSDSAALSVRELTVRESPFGSLLIQGSDRIKLAKAVSQILSAMEFDNEIFTFAYYNRSFLISPVRKEKMGTVSLAIGGVIPLHTLEQEHLMAIAEEYCVAPGEFNWDKYQILGDAIY